MVRVSPPDADGAAFAADVRAGLGARPKHIPCRWLYDEIGSRLFEEITALPEYTIPGAETEILTACAPALAARLPAVVSLVELGSGNSRRTRILLEAFLARGRLTYAPIDVSLEILEATARELVAAYPSLDVGAVNGTYEEGLSRLPRVAPGPRLILWLGANVGNLTRAGAAAFLRGVGERLGPGDALLVGFDLRRDPRELELAYDDPAGVTARFIKNILDRVNRELGGTFDSDAFAYRARYLETEGRVEMHLVSRRAQRVRVSGQDFLFAEGEAVHIEDSTKYGPDEIDALTAASGLALVDRWLDGERRFCDVLFRRP